MMTTTTTRFVSLPTKQNKTKKKWVKKGPLSSTREFPTQKNFRVLKHQYFLGFFGRGDFFLRGWFPTLLSKKKRRYKRVYLYYFCFVRSLLLERRRRPLLTRRKSGGVVFI